MWSPEDIERKHKEMLADSQWTVPPHFEDLENNIAEIARLRDLLKKLDDKFVVVVGERNDFKDLLIEARGWIENNEEHDSRNCKAAYAQAVGADPHPCTCGRTGLIKRIDDVTK